MALGNKRASTRVYPNLPDACKLTVLVDGLKPKGICGVHCRYQCAVRLPVLVSNVGISAGYRLSCVAILAYSCAVAHSHHACPVDSSRGGMAHDW